MGFTFSSAKTTVYSTQEGINQKVESSSVLMFILALFVCEKDCEKRVNWFSFWFCYTTDQMFEDLYQIRQKQIWSRKKTYLNLGSGLTWVFCASAVLGRFFCTRGMIVFFFHFFCNSSKYQVINWQWRTLLDFSHGLSVSVWCDEKVGWHCVLRVEHRLGG
jgi:hypothetical protein